MKKSFIFLVLVIVTLFVSSCDIDKISFGPKKLEGTVFLIESDNLNDGSSSEWIVRSKNKILSIVNNNVNLKPGLKVDISQNNVIKNSIIKPEDIIVLDKENIADSEFNLGENRVLVLIGEYGDLQFGYSLEELEQVIFGDNYSVNDFFRENSYDKTWFSGDIVGPIYLGNNHPMEEYINPGASEYWVYGILDQLISEADPYIDYTQYDRILYIMGNPTSYPPSHCVGASAETGASLHDTPDGQAMQSESYYLLGNINISSQIYLFLHELGHNFGAEHSNFVDCGYTYFGENFNNCMNDEMGNVIALMGGTGGVPRHFTANQKHKVGWFSPEDTIYTYSNEWPRNISIIPLESNNDGTKEIIIQYPTFDSTEEIPFAWDYYDDPIHAYYSIEYRQPLGYDTNDGYEGLINNNGIFITFRSWPIENDSENPPYPWITTEEHLIDLNPGDYNYIPQEDTALFEGETYFDAKNGVEVIIKVIYANESGALLEIDNYYGCWDGTLQDTCSENKPLYCIVNYTTMERELINNCQECGCPAGYSCRPDGSCQRRQGTKYIPMQAI